MLRKIIKTGRHNTRLFHRAIITRLDQEQLKYMNEEYCILVNEKDEPIGYDTKKNCHLYPDLKLHRAFSVFLFDKDYKLLLQQRAKTKITFPLYWTNTCCSHPLFNIKKENENVKGVIFAAQRKMEHELGIKEGSIPFDQFKYLTRIIYQAPFDKTWGEYEVDYILFCQSNFDLNLNKNEVEDVKLVTSEELKEFLKKEESNEIKVTPWFKMIANTFLFDWWNGMKEGRLEELKDWESIHHMNQ